MHKLKCQCGQVQGEVSSSGVCNRLVCYCVDCRIYAKHLGCDAALDSQGGSEIVQLAQPRVTITSGLSNLKVLRLTEGGLVRWYANCCGTPIGNMLASPKMSFVGLLSVALDRDNMARDFGEITAVVNTESAYGEAKPKAKGMLGVAARFLWIMYATRWRKQPSMFFDSTGQMIQSPEIVAREDFEALCAADAERRAA